MNKRAVDKLIPVAYEVLKDIEIAKNNEINKTFRGQVSTFGAAITMGSLLAAIAFFSDETNSSDVEREKIPKAIFMMIKRTNGSNNNIPEKDLFSYVKKRSEDACKEQIVDCAIALKLAMGLYKLVSTRRT